MLCVTNGTKEEQKGGLGSIIHASIVAKVGFFPLCFDYIK